MTTRPHAHPLFPSPITLDSLDDLFAFHRARFGGWSMEDAGGSGSGGGDGGGSGDGGQGGDNTGDGGDNGQGSGGGAGGDGGQSGAPKKLDLTQADLDRIINEKLGKEKARYEQQIKDLKDGAGKTELEKVTAERDRFKEQAENSGKAGGQRLAKSEAKVAALAANGRTDRMAAIVAQADLSDAVGDDGEVDEGKVKTAIEKVLADFPEWKQTGGKSGNDLGGDKDKTDKPTFTRDQIRKMSPEERAKRIDELNEAAAEGRITG